VDYFGLIYAVAGPSPLRLEEEIFGYQRSFLHLLEPFSRQFDGCHSKSPTEGSSFSNEENVYSNKEGLEWEVPLERSRE
jgi:hypothetical protein